jgi:hypothetical protein
VNHARTCRLACAVMLGFAAITAQNESAARAAEVAAQLDYVAAAGCPRADDFEAIVTGRLGYGPFRTNAGERVIVRIEPAGRPLEGRIEWRDAAGGWIGEQTFPSRTGDCGELARAMGFALALQIQLMATAAAEPRPRAEPPPAGVTAAPVTAAVSPTVAVPPTARPVTSEDEAKAALRSVGPSITVGAGGAVGLGVASSAVPFGRLLGAVEWSHVAVELAGEISAPSTTHRANGAGFSQQQILASVAGCGVRRPLRACLVGKVGEIRVVGQGIDVPATATGPVVQAGLRLAVTQIVGSSFQIGAHADGLALITQGIVTLDSMPVWTAPRLAVLFGADIAVRFP